MYYWYSLSWNLTSFEYIRTNTRRFVSVDQHSLSNRTRGEPYSKDYAGKLVTKERKRRLKLDTSGQSNQDYNTNVMIRKTRSQENSMPNTRIDQEVEPRSQCSLYWLTLLFLVL